MTTVATNEIDAALAAAFSVGNGGTPLADVKEDTQRLVEEPAVLSRNVKVPASMDRERRSALVSAIALAVERVLVEQGILRSAGEEDGAPSPLT